MLGTRELSVIMKKTNNTENLYRMKQIWTTTKWQIGSCWFSRSFHRNSSRINYHNSV